MIRLTEVRLNPRCEELVLAVLRSGQLAQGKMVEEFENAFAASIGIRHAIAVSSGTTALVAAIEGLGIGPGDEVISTPFTFVATVNAILEAGARAQFVDIRGDDYTMDVDLLAEAIGPRTRAVMPVHLYGYPADMPALMAVAERRGLAVVEDAAQAHGASVGGADVGTFGTGCFSFYATKNLTTGEGGMVTTNDDELADRLRLLRSQGMRQRYVYELAGHNYRMTELQAAIGLAELERLPELTARRRENAARLSSGLSACPYLVLPVVAPNRTHVFHQYTVRLTQDAPIDRDRLHLELARQGVESGVYYPRTVLDYDCYRGHPGVMARPVPVAEAAAQSVLSLPVHPWLTESDIDRVIESVCSAFTV